MSFFSKVGTNIILQIDSEEIPDGYDVKMKEYNSAPDRMALADGTWGTDPNYEMT